MNRPLRAVIVDDEPLARARLSRLLGREREVEVLAEFGDGESAAEGLQALAADVVFVDVRMPQLDGFGMLERLDAARAVDYLVKPVAPERLHESVQRVRRQMSAHADAAPAAQDGHASYPERLAVPDGLRVRIVAVRDIECVLAQGNYVELKIGGRSLLLRETMVGIHARLDPRSFVRIHRSRIVRIDMIEQIEPYGAGQYVVRMRDGTRFTSGRSYRGELRRALGMAAVS